ncbi:MAG: extracellular solute-binding protein, partial [Chloroflexi bacterium]|nr:extracellular solute-binding protein [Chloroflexota bacterium]
FEVMGMARPEYMDKINLLMTAGELSGFVRAFSGEDPIKYKADGTILPLGDYLKDNPVWNALPQYLRELYMIDGEIMALSPGENRRCFTRSIRKDWLDNLGLDIPTTLEELYETFKQFTRNDPDGNGKDDTVGLTSRNTWTMQDLFQSHDAILDHVGGTTVIFDPNNDQWTDSMLKPGMRDALIYIRNLYEEGFLDPEFMTNSGGQMRTAVYSGYAGSIFYWDNFGYGGATTQVQKHTPEGEFYEIVGIKSKWVDKQFNNFSVGSAPYVLIKGTPEPEKQANAFINIFFGDEYGHFSGRWGVKDMMFTITTKPTGEKQVTRLVKEYVEGARKWYPNPAIIDAMPGFTTSEYALGYQADDQETAARRLRLNRLQAETHERGFATGVLYRQYEWMKIPKSPLFADIHADYQKLFQETVARVVTGQIGIDEGIAEYRKQMKAMGGQKLLDESNEILDKKSTLPGY